MRPALPTLAGADLEDESRPKELSAAAAAGFEALWRFVDDASPVDTSQLQPFEGIDAKWHPCDA